MATILEEILAHKLEEVVRARREVSDAEMAARADGVSEAPRGFRRALCESAAPRIIAEVKRRSPSKGLIREDFEPVSCARAYVEGNAAALSVLTDEHYFGGHLDFLREIRKAVDLPLLRKDFVVDAYQVDEARAAGADAVLLIVAALDAATLARLHTHARSRGLDVLVEVHDADELDQALTIDADLIGINNRNLKTFVTDLAVAEELAPRIPTDVVIVAESGIGGPGDITRLAAAGADAFLVGESLMRQPDVAEALRQLRRSP
jgi:indole-3-glycerol phosphate synthase